MENEPKTNTENENLRDQSKGNGDTLERDEFLRNDNTGSDNLNDDRQPTGNDRAPEDIDDTDKYLAMEQPGVKYTKESGSVHLSDEDGYSNHNANDKWNEEGGNSEYSDAFNQDDYILQDNVDLDEDQNQSISSDDDDFEETNERY
jgi:hypothetical protein